MNDFTRKIFAMCLFLALAGIGYGQEIVNLNPRFVNGEERELRIKTDQDNNTVIAGEAYIPPGGLGGTPGPTNIFVEKYTTAGEHLWTITTDYSLSSNDAEIQNIELDQEGNIYVLGNYSGSSVTLGNATLEGYSNFKIDFFYAKVNPEGEVLWIKGPSADQFPEYHRIGSRISLTDEGDILISGNFYRDMFLGGDLLEGATVPPDEVYPPQSFIARLDNEGEAIWTKSLERLNSGESNGGCGPAKMLEAPSGHIFLHMMLDSAVVMGNDTIVSPGVPASSDLHAVVKCDSDGNPIDYTITESPYNTLENLVLDKCGNPVILGTFIDSVRIGDKMSVANSSRDVFVAKLDGNLNCQWLKNYSSAEGDQALGIDTNDKNEVFFTLEFWAELDFGDGYAPENVDVALVKLDSAGNHLWHVHTTGSGTIDAFGVNVNNQNDVLTINRIRGEKLFSGNSLSTPPYDDGGFHPEVVWTRWIDNDYSGDPVECQEPSGVSNATDHPGDMQVYPNPATSILRVKFSKAPPSYREVRIYSSNGTLVHRQNITAAQATIDLSGLSKGLYVVKTAAGHNVKRFVKR